MATRSVDIQQSLDPDKNCGDYRNRFNRVSRRQTRSMMSDTRRKSNITDFAGDLEKASINPFQELFAKFCSSSTIHGTYFWIASSSALSRITWGIIVVMGIVTATFIIKNSFNAWKEHPVVTSVMQKSIETIHFPAITICPLDDTRFGYVEHQLNKKSKNILDMKELISDTIKLLHARQFQASADDCLLPKCTEFVQSLTSGSKLKNEENENCAEIHCPGLSEFQKFLNQCSTFLQPTNLTEKNEAYDQFIQDQLSSTRGPKEAETRLHWKGKRRRSTPEESSCNSNAAIDCSILVSDFRFLNDYKKLIKDVEDNDRPGTVLKMLMTQLEGLHDLQETLFSHYVKSEDFPELYAKAWLNLSRVDEQATHLPLHDLISVLSNRIRDFDHTLEKATDVKEKRSMKFEEINVKEDQLARNSQLLKALQMSLQPPHAIENGEIVPNAAFPFCFYGSSKYGSKEGNESVGTFLPDYQEHYCNVFRTTFNEHGLCYTFNNADQGSIFKSFEDGKSSTASSSRFVGVRKVSGCGKQRGFQLAVDSQRLTSLLPKDHLTKGFRVFVTMPGVVTSKVPFWADPTFQGEHNFYIHGIHVIKSSSDFRKWNEQNKACYFPNDKKLTFFKLYSQDNCLLECRLKKITKLCNCTPWYLEQTGLDICTLKGNQCLEQALSNYEDDLADRQECDCLNDCEMVHFFSTLQRQPYYDLDTATRWFKRDGDQVSGIMANYLMDPENIFNSKLAKNLTKLANNLTTDADLAQKRFNEDITILNFFFDTPIITEITLDLKTSIFDMISAIGGTLGLFTGISVITLVEVMYWAVKLSGLLLQSFLAKLSKVKKSMFGTTSPTSTTNTSNSLENGANGTGLPIFRLHKTDTSNELIRSSFL